MKILLVDDEEAILQTTSVAFESMGHEVETAKSAAQARFKLDEEELDVVFLDLMLGEHGKSLDLIDYALEKDASLAVIVFTAHSTIESAVEAMRRGAHDYLQKPFVPDEVRRLLEKVEKEKSLRRRVQNLESELAATNPVIELSSREPRVQKVYEMAEKAAASEASLILLGPSGTGKTILARHIHSQSNRRDKPFVTVHCPSLSRELLESELFGHVKGAFTGAVQDTWGKVAAANEGTLFLDEIGELPLDIQSKLLRLLQERAYERVGETKTRYSNIRFIAATNIDLKEQVKNGNFREDLYFRINVVSLQLPRLANRPRDILPLAQNYIDFFSGQMGKPGVKLNEAAEKALLQYPWPGNLRELRNVIERALIFCAHGVIDPQHFPKGFHDDMQSVIRPGHDVSLEELEKEHIMRILEKEESVSNAARILGIDAATLYRKRKRYGFD